MKIDFTSTEFRANLFGILFALIVFTALISFSGCSSGIEQNNNSNQTSFSGDQSFHLRIKDQIGEWILKMMKYPHYTKMEPVFPIMK